MHVECGLRYQDVIDQLMYLANINKNSSWRRQRLVVNHNFPPFANIFIWRILFSVYNFWESLRPAKTRTNHCLRRFKVTRGFLRWYLMINDFNNHWTISSLRKGFS